MAAPADTVKLFADEIKPVPPLDGKRFQQLLADLDSANFAERESASKTLGDFGQQAKPYLVEAIKTTKSTEVRARVSKILDGLKTLTPDQVRQVRAVLVLELIDTEDSRNLLKKWAGGLKGALLTDEAAAALERLEDAAKAKPTAN